MKEEYNNQLEFNKKFLTKRGIDISNISKELLVPLIKDFVLHLIKEATEVLDTVQFKMHRKIDVEFIETNTVEELIDCQKYLWGLFQLMGVSYEDLKKEYWRKTQVVEQRYHQEHELKEFAKHKKVCAVDLDGVLCKYPEPWLYYLNDNLQTSYTTLKEAKIKVDMLTYSSIKSKYRQSGVKKNIEPIEGSVEFLEMLKYYGYSIVILTSRPYKKYFRLFADTLDWLRDNNMKYDSILFDDNKNMKILKEIPNIQFMVEDSFRYANSVAAVGYRCYLMVKTLNDKWLDSRDVHNNVVVVDGFKKILENEIGEKHGL